MKIKKKISYLVICLLTFFLFNNSAHAYLDPGTGSLIFQAIIALFAGIATAISIYWRKFKDFISNLFSKNKKK
jgi:hypothetical protein